MALRMASAFSGRTLPPFMYLEMVDGDTPAFRATSLIVAIFPSPLRESIRLFVTQNPRALRLCYNNIKFKLYCQYNFCEKYLDFLGKVDYSICVIIGGLAALWPSSQIVSRCSPVFSQKSHFRRLTMAKVRNMIAFDLGASNGRAILGQFDGEKLTMTELHRFENNYVEMNGVYYWDTPYLYSQLKQGLLKFKQGGYGDLDSFGIDTWGVDYGLLDRNGQLAGLPRSYRLGTQEDIDAVKERIPADVLYSRSGIDTTLTFNTLHRHISHMVCVKVMSAKSPWLAGAQPGGVYTSPASHGEGRFVASKEWIDRLFANGQVATVYCDPDGRPVEDAAWNVNGSFACIEGITSPDGRVFGKMAHIERRGQHVAINITGEQDMKVFESGVRYYS
jgi:hypothetical protein